MMGKAAILAALILAAVPFGRAQADPPRTAIFDFELVDTSLEGEMLGASGAESRRLDMLTARLREALAASGRYDVVDISSVREEAGKANLRSCGGCDLRLAAALGAEISVTGFVQKVSNLILNINLYVRDVASGATIAAYSADIRSNTDESWQRGLDWLLKNRLLAEEPRP